MSLEWRFIFAENDAGFSEDLGAAVIHTVLELVYDLHHTCLDDFHGTAKTWAPVLAKHVRVAIDNRPFCTAAVATQFQQCVFFSVQTETLVQVAPARRAFVASSASTLVAICEPTGCSIVSGRKDAVLAHNHGPDASLHAIGAQGCKRA